MVKLRSHTTTPRLIFSPPENSLQYKALVPSINEVEGRFEK